MNLHGIAFRNLRRRKAKATFVLLGLMIAVSSVVVFISLIDALTNDINHKLEHYGANILIVPKTENLSLNYGGLSIGGISYDMQEIRHEDLSRIWSIRNVKNIAAVGPILLGAVQVRDRRVLLAGVDFEAFQALRPWWTIKGTAPQNGEILAGSAAARILELSTGERIDVGGHEMEVTGMIEPTGSQDDQILFAPLLTAQKVLGKEGKISMAEVAALCHGCPVEEMVDQISRVLPGANVMAIKQVVQGRMETLNHFRKVSYGLSALIALVGCLIVLVTMMSSVRERMAEIGIFRAIGFRQRHVLKIILFEAGMISALAGLWGYLVGLGITRLSVSIFTESHNVAVPFDPILAGVSIGLALILGTASSLYPAFMAARLDPNEALRAL
jgi:putative ABC transport system permease protein